MPNPPTIKENGGNQAVYFPSFDEIGIPKRENFDKEESFYNTLFHELGHSTGHEKRLNRVFSKSKSVKDLTYAKEELVAEITACLLCGHCQIETATIKNTSAYIADWLRAFNDDPKMVISCASKAQKAADYILDVKFSNESEN